jgi:hypothetical protein
LYKIIYKEQKTTNKTQHHTKPYLSRSVYSFSGCDDDDDDDGKRGSCPTPTFSTNKMARPSYFLPGVVVI